MTTLTLRIPDELDQELERQSTATRLSKSDLAREALQRYLQTVRFRSLRSKLVPLAQAEGINTDATKAAFVILLALTIAIAMKIVGILLTIAFLIVPGSAARPLAATPELMTVLAAVLGMIGVAGGLVLSMSLDTPGGPSIVLVLSLIFVATTMLSILRERSAG